MKVLMKKNRGFTLVELLIVIAIMAILGAASIPIYGNLQVQSQLDETGDFIIQSIRMTKQKAEARYNNSIHGVKFLSSSFILYQGDSYVTRNQDYDRVESIGSVMTLSTTLINNEINFNKGLGEPSNFGEIIINHSNSRVVNININSWGIIEKD